MLVRGLAGRGCTAFVERWSPSSRVSGRCGSSARWRLLRRTRRRPFHPTQHRRASMDVDHVARRHPEGRRLPSVGLNRRSGSLGRAGHEPRAPPKRVDRAVMQRNRALAQPSGGSSEWSSVPRRAVVFAIARSTYVTAHPPTTRSRSDVRGRLACSPMAVVSATCSLVVTPGPVNTS